MFLVGVDEPRIRFAHPPSHSHHSDHGGSWRSGNLLSTARKLRWHYERVQIPQESLVGAGWFLKTAMVFGHIPLWFNDPKWGWVKIEFYPILTYVKKELLSRILLKYVSLHSHWYEVTSMHWTPMRDAWTIWYLCSHQPMRAWALLWASHVLRFASNVLRPAGAKSSMTCWHMKIFAWAPILMVFERPGNESGRRTFGRSNRIKQTASGCPVARCRCVWTWGVEPAVAIFQ